MYILSDTKTDRKQHDFGEWRVPIAQNTQIYTLQSNYHGFYFRNRHRNHFSLYADNIHIHQKYQYVRLENVIFLTLTIFSALRHCLQILSIISICLLPLTIN